MSQGSLLDNLRNRIPDALNIIRLAALLFVIPVYAFVVLRSTMCTIAIDLVAPYLKLLIILKYIAIATLILELLNSKLVLRNTIWILFKLVILYVSVQVFMNHYNFSLGAFLVAVIALSGVDENRILKAVFSVGAAVVVVFFILSLLGLVDNNRGDSFGFTYRTHYASFLISMILVYAIIKDGWFNWLEESALLLLDLYVLWLRAKTSFVCLFVLTVFILWRHYRAEGSIPYQDVKSYGVISYLYRVIYMPIVLMDRVFSLLHGERFRNIFIKLLKYSFVIWFAVSLLLTATYRYTMSFWERIPILETLNSRLMMNVIGFEEFPITMFGNSISQAGNSVFETYKAFYYVIDSSYIRLIIQFGVSVTLVVLGLMTVLQFRLYKIGRYFTMFAVSIFAMDCFMNYHLTNMHMNVFALLIFCTFSSKPGPEVCRKLNFSGISRRRCWAGGIAGLLMISFIFIWCSTAYKITNWRGHTPVYGATLVVPGDYLHKGGKFMDTIEDYMVKHSDSYCIVSCGADADDLVSRGISPERIYVQDSGSIDEMLSRSHDLIDSDNLPSRLTVCADRLQMERVQLTADSMHIPINALPVDSSSSGYLSLFASEQWSLLCGN